MEAEIKYINYGIACRINDTIYLNKNLKKYPDLHNALLEHEQEHSSGLVFKDLVIDIKGKHLDSVKREYYKFIFKHPKSLSQFIPIWFYEGKFSFDPFIFALWVLVIIMFAIIFGVIK